MEYCKNCKYLFPKECDQTIEKEHHLCVKYHKRVLHMGHHPEIVRLQECDEPSNNACTGLAPAVAPEGNQVSGASQ
jgi:hypothetical protein